MERSRIAPCPQRIQGIDTFVEDDHPPMRNLIIAAALCFAFHADAQTVQNTSYTNTQGERVLRLEMILPVNKAEAWKLISTAEGWQRWASPVVEAQLRTGGMIRTNYDKTKVIGDSGTIDLPIINYIEGELLTLKVVLNATFPEKVRQQHDNLQELVQLTDLGDGRTRLTSSMIGWGTGPDWNWTYEFFAAGNAWSYEQLANVFRKGTQD